jgi:hypothetical protein
MGPFMQMRRLSAVRYLDITVANRSVGSLQSSCVEVFIQVKLCQLKMEDLDTEWFMDEVKKRKAIWDSSSEEFFFSRK